MLRALGVAVRWTRWSTRRCPPTSGCDGRSPCPPARGEHEALAELRAHRRARTRSSASSSGMGYYDTITPPVIQRNILENPGWYTAYTPYQAEISQGRLEALLNFQTMVTDLTGLRHRERLAARRGDRRRRGDAHVRTRLSKDDAQARSSSPSDCHPQTIAVVQTRAKPLGIEVRRRRSTARFDFAEPVFGVLVQYPATRRARSAITRRFVEARARGRRAGRSSRPTCSRSRCCARRANSARTSRSARRSASACRWASAARTPASSRRRTQYKRQMPGRLVGVSQGRARQARAIAWRCRRASSTSAATRPRQQHLHRAGAARGHGRDVRRLSRPRGTARASPRACTRSPRVLRRGPARGSGFDVAHDAVLRHGARATSPTAARDPARPPRERGINLRAVDDGTRRHRARRDDRPPATFATLARAFSRRQPHRASASRRSPRPSDADVPGAARAHQRRSSRIPSSTRTTPSTRCCATSGGSRRGTSRSPLDDPARLVHDEAERDERDDAGHVAGVRQAASRSRPPSRPQGYAKLFAQLEAWLARDHRLRRRSRCSRTPARRANTPACS